MTVSNLPERDWPLSEQFRVVAKRWVDLDAAANLLEETKSAVLAQKMAELGDIPVSKAEMKVKASSDWYAHIEKIIDARKDANLAKLQLEYIRMKHSEWQSVNANMRHEARLGR